MFRFLRIERPTIATLRPTWTRDVDRLLHPVHVRRERRDEDPARAQRDQLPERLADEPLRAGDPGPLGVRRVAEQQVDARLPSSASRPTSVFSPSTGVWSSFQSPVCDDAAGGGLEHDRDAVRDRVRHAHEVERERADLGSARPVSASCSSVDAREAVLVELRLDQAERQLRRDHLVAVDLAQQVRQPADVVLVPVREHDRVDALAVSQVA